MAFSWTYSHPQDTAKLFRKYEEAVEMVL
jgi:hypothetical protein